MMTRMMMIMKTGESSVVGEEQEKGDNQDLEALRREELGRKGRGREEKGGE